MAFLLKYISEKIGIDKAIAYSSGASIVQAFTGVGSIFFISTFLSGVEQGFYFTFCSIIALQIFFELGLTGIMTQYVAHEAAHLERDEQNVYQGNDKYKSRLASLIRFCLKWFTILALVIFVFLFAVGYIYFSRFGNNSIQSTEWLYPWILVCVGTSIKFFESPLTSILTGLGFVRDMNKISFYQQIIIPISTWIGFVCGLKLYVLGIGYILSTLVWFFFFFKDRLSLIIFNLLKVKITERVEYIKEIFPYQWRIALSWVSGYFIFQLFNPVIFATEGAVAAGQMGMTLQALNAIQAFSFSWLNTKIPQYSKYIALKEYPQLDILFKKTLKQMVSVCAILLVVFFGTIWALQATKFTVNGNVVADRFLSGLPLAMVIIPVFLQQFVNSWATYLRCHKKEPFLANSIVNGILSGVSTIVLGNLFGLNGVTIGYCTIAVCMFPWGYWLYCSNKKKWHQTEEC